MTGLHPSELAIDAIRQAFLLPKVKRVEISIGIEDGWTVAAMEMDKTYVAAGRATTLEVACLALHLDYIERKYEPEDDS